MTNPVVEDTKVTDPGSKPLGTVVPAGAPARVVVVSGGTDVVVLEAALLDGAQAAAARARHSTMPSAADGWRRRSVTESLCPDGAPPDRDEGPERHGSVSCRRDYACWWVGNGEDAGQGSGRGRLVARGDSSNSGRRPATPWGEGVAGRQPDQHHCRSFDRGSSSVRLGPPTGQGEHEDLLGY